MTRFVAVGVFGALALLTVVQSLSIGHWRPFDSPGLYNESDRVAELYFYDFKCNVYGSEKIWLVEFYNTWCGFCQRMAPIYKSLAENISGWDNLVTVAAIDCAVDENYPICKEYEVLKTPTLKLFTANAAPNDPGIKLQHDYDENLLRNTLVKQLVIEAEKRHLPGWPNITLVKGSDVGDLKHEFKEQVNYKFLILEKPTSQLGVEVILDLQEIKDVEIRRGSLDQAALAKSLSVPSDDPALELSLVVLGPDNSPEVIPLEAPTRDAVETAIVSYLESKGQEIEVVKDTLIDPSSKNKVACGKRPEFKAVDEREQEEYSIVVDIEKAIRFALMREVVFSHSIGGEKMQALKNFMLVLSKYLPKELHDSYVFVNSLKARVENSTEMTGANFLKLAEKSEALASERFKKHDWSTCRGSEARFRGYPCGLWTLFHTLTVAAAHETNNNNNNNNSPRSEFTVLQAMHGYIKNFFGCADCSRHFVEMSARRKLFEVREGDESVMWLWEAHNEVNQRLHGDASEDPQHPKVQYPSPTECPRCRDANGDWIESEVLAFLKEHYRMQAPQVPKALGNEKLRERGSI